MGKVRPTRLLARSALAASVLLAVAGGAFGAASAATLTTDFPCYFEKKTLTWTAIGFAKETDYRLTVDGTEVGSGKTNADGNATGTLTSANLPSNTGEKRFVLAISDGTTSAEAPFRVSEFNADFAPSSGDPTTLKVRFSIFGFGARKTIFLHYLRPGVTGSRAVAKTVRLGKVKGDCGKISGPRSAAFFPSRRPPASGGSSSTRVASTGPGRSPRSCVGFRSPRTDGVARRSGARSPARKRARGRLQGSRMS